MRTLKRLLSSDAAPFGAIAITVMVFAYLGKDFVLYPILTGICLLAFVVSILALLTRKGYVRVEEGQVYLMLPKKEKKESENKEEEKL